MWMLHMGQNDRVDLKHAINEREYRLPGLHHFSVDCYSSGTKNSFLVLWLPLARLRLLDVP